MFKKVLIANRGEIALRIVRACKVLGIRTVAIYSQADANALHVAFADESVCIGPAPALKSYLNQPAVLAAVEITGADAVHPGYGFLAENAQFASAVRAMGVEFIGPSVEHLRMFGDKLSAKAAARGAGLPLLEGSPGAATSMEDAMESAKRTGFPVILKAAAGGGGKGMRVVESEEELPRGFNLAQEEARVSFGNGDVFVERYLPSPRHIEVQIAADGKGGAIHLGTRDCSLQRRHQKLVEEAPAPNMSDATRKRICDAAVALASDVQYQTLATVEFLLEGDDFFFLEVNPRIQVEHPVTEEVTGVDLVEEQLRLAAGEGLSLTQDEVQISGHAIEVRVNAEDPWRQLPSPGPVTGYHEPGGPGVRVDSAIHEHAFVQPYYDSLTAKLIVKGRDRNHCIERLLCALDEFVVEGIQTSIPLQRELVDGAVFRESRMYTRYVDSFLAERSGKK